MARIVILAAIIAIYASYWIYTPSSVQVTKIASSPAEYNVIQVTLQNPTFKIVTGSILRIEAEVDVPNGHGGTTVLQSVPAEYPFTLLPQSSQQMSISMNPRVLPGFEYDITLRIDSGGQKTVTLTLPKP